MTKFCNGCGIIKDISEFNKCLRNLSGLQSQCKECKNKNYIANRDTRMAQMRTNYADKKPEYSARAARYQKENSAAHNKRNREYHRRNPGIRRASVARRHAAKLNRTPKWLTKEQKKQITDIYRLAADLSWLSEGGLHVDHIIPLRGKTVSGLHVPENLQIVPKLINLRKGNKI